MTDFEEKTKEVTHPLEDAFGIPKGTTPIPYTETVSAEIVVTEDYDEKDTEIEAQLQEVYELALAEFESQSNRVGSDSRYAARNSEVAAIFLNTALNAVGKKADIKGLKDKLKTKPANRDGNGSAKTIHNNNLIVTQRDLLKAMEDAD